MASSYVVAHEFLRVVEDILALEYLESLATSTVSGRDGIVAAGNEFFAFGCGDRNAVIKPPLPMMEGCVLSWLVWFPRRVSCNSQVECHVLLRPVFPGVHQQQWVDVSSGARERVCCCIGGPSDVRDLHTVAPRGG